MSAPHSIRRIPPDWLFHLGLLLTIVCVALSGSIVLPILAYLRTTDVGLLYGCGAAAGLAAVGLLFAARLPLYRRRCFWTFGPRRLDRMHRRLYWLAHALVVASFLFFSIVWLKIR